MADDPLWFRLLPPTVRTLPADLAAVIIVTLAAILAASAPGIAETPLRIILGLPFVLFLPGYAFIAALFPERATTKTTTTSTTANNDQTAIEDTADTEETVSTEGIDGIERVALSFGLSIAVVPLLGLVLNFTPWGIRLLPILVSVGGWTLLATAIAARRRRALPAEERFQVPYREWLAAGRSELFEPETRTDAMLNVLLAISVILAVSSVGYAVAVPKQGEAFTELFLLTEDQERELIADEYPTELTQGQPEPIVVGIGNHEHETMTYTVVVELQHISIQNNSTVVHNEQELDRFGTRVAHNETRLTKYNITPTMTGQRLRLAFLLYRGSPPADADVETAYRENHLFVNVTAPARSS